MNDFDVLQNIAIERFKYNRFHYVNKKYRINDTFVLHLTVWLTNKKQKSR